MLAMLKRSLSPVGIQLTWPRWHWADQKWGKEAISAGVWGLCLSVRLSGCRVRGMGLECWLTGPRPPGTPGGPVILAWEQIMIRGPDPSAPKSPVTLARFPPESVWACVCDKGRILMQSRDQLAHLSLLTLHLFLLLVRQSADETQRVAINNRIWKLFWGWARKDVMWEKRDKERERSRISQCPHGVFPK